MVDLTGALIQELRADPVVAGLVPADRIRGAELSPGDSPPMVILERAGTERVEPAGRGGSRMALQDSRWYVRCYAADRIGAAQLSGAVSDVLHARGPRSDSQGRLIYLTLDEGGHEAEVDPDTKWPLETLVIRARAAAEVVG